MHARVRIESAQLATAIVAQFRAGSPQVMRRSVLQARSRAATLANPAVFCRYARNTTKSCRCTRSFGRGSALLTLGVFAIWRPDKLRSAMDSFAGGRRQLAPVSNASAAAAIGCRGDWNWGCSPVRLHRIHRAQSITIETSPFHSLSGVGRWVFFLSSIPLSTMMAEQMRVKLFQHVRFEIPHFGQHVELFLHKRSIQLDEKARLLLFQISFY